VILEQDISTVFPLAFRMSEHVSNKRRDQYPLIRLSADFKETDTPKTCRDLCKVGIDMGQL
jgi:hypothetical protein